MIDRPATAYKILTAPELAELESGRFAGSADDRRDGFIHLSTRDQLEGTLARHFAGRDGLHIAAVDLSVLGDAIRWEAARDEDFPHLYGDLPLTAVIAYSPLHRSVAGTVDLPVTG